MKTLAKSEVVAVESQPTAKKERLLTFDIAKGIGILLVVFAHINHTPILLSYIYSFHMPLFFILSGMFFKKDKYRTFWAFAKQKFLTLICPYIFFYLAAMVVKFAISVIYNGLTSEVIHEYLMYFVQMFIAEKSATVIDSPLWFVPCLFAVECIYYFVSKLKPAFSAAVCALLVCLGWFLESGLIPVQNVIFPWNLPTAFFAIGFYAIGHLTFGRVKEATQKIKSSKHGAIIAAACALLCFLIIVPCDMLNGKVTMGSRVLNNGFIFYISGIVGTVGVLLLSTLLEKAKFLLFCGQNSFSIMATHHLIRHVYICFYSLLGIKMYDQESIVETIIPVIVILALSLVCTLIYNKLSLFKKKAK